MSLYQELTTNNNQAEINKIINAYKSTNDPQQLLMNMAMKNPNIQKIIDMINESGQTPKDLFFQMARQKGIDPNIIINMFNK